MTTDIADLTVGTRVRTRHAIDRYPHFLAPAGALGTVTSTPSADPSGTLCVKMDEIIDGAEDWDNEIVWSVGDGDDPLSALDVLCRNCGNEIEPHPSGLCDSCETQDAFDRASAPRYLARVVSLPMRHWVVIDTEEHDVVWDRGAQGSKTQALEAAFRLNEAR